MCKLESVKCDNGLRNDDRIRKFDLRKSFIWKDLLNVDIEFTYT